MKGKIIKIIIPAVFIFVAALFFFSSKSNKNSGAALISAAKNKQETSSKSKQKLIEQGEEILRILNLIGEINLDADIFSDAAYLNLGDFSEPLPKKEIGKSNPFSSFK